MVKLKSRVKAHVKGRSVSQKRRAHNKKVSLGNRSKNVAASGALAGVFDRKLTMAENYRALGIVSVANPSHRQRENLAPLPTFAADHALPTLPVITPVVQLSMPATEVRILLALLAEHGTDLCAAEADTKLNPYQLTGTQIARRIAYLVKFAEQQAEMQQERVIASPEELEMAAKFAADVETHIQEYKENRI